MKRCSACNREFPPATRFCPYDGTALEVTAEPQPNNAAATPTVIDGRYRLEQLVRECGRVAIHQATDLASGTPVLLKTVNTKALPEPLVQRLLNEATSLMTERHAALAQVLRFGRQLETNTLLAVVDTRGARTLEQRLREAGPLDEQHARDALEQLCSAAQAMKLLRISMRGITSADIRVDESYRGSPQVFVDPLWMSIAVGDETSLGTGAPVYVQGWQTMSPEECRGEAPGARSDVYRLGILGYELLAGRPPFISNLVRELIATHLDEAPPPFEFIAPTIRPAYELERVIMRALAKLPQYRHESIVAFAAELERPSTTRPTTVLREATLEELAQTESNGGYVFGSRASETRTLDELPFLEPIADSGPPPPAFEFPAIEPDLGTVSSREITPSVDDQGTASDARDAAAPDVASSNGGPPPSAEQELPQAPGEHSSSEPLSSPASAAPQEQVFESIAAPAPEVDEEDSLIDESHPIASEAELFVFVEPGSEPVASAPEEPTAASAAEVTAPAIEPAAPSPAAEVTAPAAEPADEATATAQPLYLDENVQFTVYRPRVVQPLVWSPLIAFAHLSEGSVDDESDQIDPVEEVARQAAQVLGERIEEFQAVVQDSNAAVPREGELTFIPNIPGVEFNPTSRSFRWTESVHREEFRLRASGRLDGQTARGRMSVFLGGVLLAEVALSIRVDSNQASQNSDRLEHASAQPYRKIFASYSHKDSSIVEQFETFVEALGDRYLRDVRDLRSGEIWSAKLEKLILEADVFQLFWSRNSMFSTFVREEWEYALSLRRPHFIRPTYWEEPLPSSAEHRLPPETLSRLHFQRIRSAAGISIKAGQSTGSLGSGSLPVPSKPSSSPISVGEPQLPHDERGTTEFAGSGALPPSPSQPGVEAPRISAPPSDSAVTDTLALRTPAAPVQPPAPDQPVTSPFILESDLAEELAFPRPSPLDEPIAPTRPAASATTGVPPFTTSPPAVPGTRPPDSRSDRPRPNATTAFGSETPAGYGVPMPGAHPSIAPPNAAPRGAGTQSRSPNTILIIILFIIFGAIVMLGLVYWLGQFWRR